MHLNADRPMTVEVMLADPIVRQVMASDGVRPEDLRALWLAARDRLVRARKP